MHPGDQLTRIGTVSPDQGQTTEAPADRSQNQPGAITVLHAGAMNHYPQKQSHRVNDNMTFAPVDLLAGVIASLSALLSCLDRLRVDDGCRR